MKHSEMFPLTWAVDIEVEVAPQHLKVMGNVLSSDAQVQPKQDLFHRYLEWTRDWSEKRGGRNPPHIQFANAKTDQQLIAFVRTFGPVAASSIEEVNTTDDWTLTAIQSIGSLRRERQTYAAALTLLVELDPKGTANPQTIQTCLSQISEGCRHWTPEWRTESEWRKLEHCRPPSWHFDESAWESLAFLKVSAERYPDPKGPEILVSSGAFADGHQTICRLVNTFAGEVRYFGNTRYEGPPAGSLRFGVRPVLYYILRLEYLRRGRVRLCQNTQCNQLFLEERNGQRFCSEDCSRKQRQRDYWLTSGSKLRLKRRGTRKAALNKLPKKRREK